MEHPRTDAAPQGDATFQHPDDASSAEPAPDAADGKIVAIESGRQRREGRSAGDRPRAERAERRERRKQRAGGEPGEAETPTDGAPSATAVAIPDAAELPEESAEELAAAGGRILVAPLMPADASGRAVDRTRSQIEAAERAMATYPDVTSAIAPLVRHVNAVTEQLNEAQIGLGRVMAERDALKLKVAELQGIDVSEVSVIPALAGLSESGDGLQLRAVGASSANIQPETGAKRKLIPPALNLGVGPGASPEHVKRVARKRQLIAACLFAAVGIGLVIAQRQGNDISKVSRDSLADLQFVGIFFNMFFMIWMLYRVVRVGGKGAKWLFPQEPTKRRR